MLEVLARIRHRRMRRQLSPYLDGMLSAGDRRRFEEHLAQCQACRDELAELRATVRAMAELPLVEAPRSFALAEPRPAWVVRPALRRLELGLRLATVAAALALAAVLVGDFVGLPGRSDEGEHSVVGLAQRGAAATQAGAQSQAAAAPSGSPADQYQSQDKAAAAAPSASAAATSGAEGEATAPPELAIPATGGEGQPPSATPEPAATLAAAPPPATMAPQASQAGTTAATAAATPTPGAATPPPTPASGSDRTNVVASPPPPAAGVLGGVAGETPAATPTPQPAGALAPSGAERQPPAEGGQPLAGPEGETPAAEEGGPSRETVVRWVEIGLGSGLALLFVSWAVARRRRRA